MTSVEIRLPYADVRALGCLRRAENLPDGAARSRYYWWGILHEFPDGEYPGNHWMSVSFTVDAPSATPLTAREFNHASQNVSVAVYETRGEPPRLVSQTPVPRASIRFEAGVIHLRFEGTDAVAAFLRANTDRVRALSCPTSPADVTPLRLTHR